MNNEHKEKRKTFQILEVTPDDVLGTLEVQRATWLATYVNEDHGITAEDIIAKDFTSPERIARRTKSLVEKKDIVKMLVAKNDQNAVVAFCAAEKGEKVNKLGAVYVLPEYQGHGAGKRLMETAFAWLGSNKDIQLDVVTYNEKAAAIYEKMGFKKVGETPIEDLSKMPSGKTMPEVRMIKSHK